MFQTSFKPNITLTAGSGIIDAGSSAAGLILPSGTTAQRPTSPTVGMSRYNTTINASEIWNGAAWTAYSAIPYLEILLIGGGGGGGYGSNGNYDGGGGGAGGVILTALTYLPSMTITIGSGGAANTNGISSKITVSGVDILTAVGGGAAINGGVGASGGSGGGGGGGSNVTHAGGTGTTGQGFAGGAGVGTSYAGGGGGAGGVGQDGTNNSVGGYGGYGITNSFTGPILYYAGGGAGTPISTSGGGYNAGGGWLSTGGGNGRVNTGGGGGGGLAGQTLAGGTGGSGIAILRYPTTFSKASATTNATVSSVNNYWVYTWLTSGTITF